ncbi:MAG: methyltransferase domain-containing protein [Pirellulaceae bacterium]|nr:methyltransferase domain-containing protein [Pirellulaceae bacterium]
MSKLREQIMFLNTFIRRPAQVGAVAPSSQRLCKMLVDSFDWNEVQYVVEFGPGTGVATQLIVDRLRPDAKFFAIERSPKFVALSQRRCPTADIVHGCVTDVQRLCHERGIPHLDAVVSGLPWASFSTSLQNDIFEAMFRMLRPGGRFATFAYLQGLGLPAGIRFSKLLKKNFTTVTKSRTVWRNLPPALVYRGVR